MYEALIQGAAQFPGIFERQRAEPYNLAHLQSLTRLQAAQAGEAEQRLSSHQAFLAMMQGWKAQEGAKPADILTDMGMMAMKAGDMPDAEKALGLAGQVGQRDAMMRYYNEQAELRQLQQRGLNLSAIGRSYGTIQPGPDGKISPEAMLMSREMFIASGGDPRAVQGIEDLIQRGGPAAVHQLYTAGAGLHQTATEEAAAKRLVRQEAEDARRERYRQQRLELSRKAAELQVRRLEAAGKAGGKDVAKIDERERNMAAAQLTALGAKDAFEGDSEGFKALTDTVASNAKQLRLANPNLSESESMVKAYNALLQGNSVTPAPAKMFDAFTGRERKKFDPQRAGAGRAAPQPDITQEAYSKLRKGDKYWWKGQELTKE